MMKRIFALILAAAMLAGCAPMGAGISTAGKTLESVGEALEHKPAPQVTVVPVPETAAPPQQEKLTAAQAEEIALAHGGFAANQVERLHTRFEPEERDEPAHYDVEFYQGGMEYDYEIHAVTGEILSWEKDK